MMNDEIFTPTSSNIPNLKPAGFWYRFFAYLIDALILGAVGLPVGMLNVLILKLVTGSVEPQGISGGIYYAASFALGLSFRVIYYGYFYSHKGASPGKMIFRLKVINVEDGSHLNYGQAALREIFGKLLSALTFLIGFIMAGMRNDKKALHDIVCNTQVLQRRI